MSGFILRHLLDRITSSSGGKYQATTQSTDQVGASGATGHDGEAVDQVEQKKEKKSHRNCRFLRLKLKSVQWLFLSRRRRSTSHNSYEPVVPQPLVLSQEKEQNKQIENVREKLEDEADAEVPEDLVANEEKSHSLFSPSLNSQVHLVSKSKVQPSTTAKTKRAFQETIKRNEEVRTKRLMKELRDVQKIIDAQRYPAFTVDLNNNNLFEWVVSLYQVDPESALHRDMFELGVPCIQLSFEFPDNFPFLPPFVRVISPHIEKGFVMEGGAICLELLTPAGWASAYTVEAIIVQVTAALSRGQARINVQPKTSKQFSRKLAETSFKSLVKTHNKYGWVTPPKSDG